MTSHSVEETRAAFVARLKSEERQAASPKGLQASAAELRSRARQMADTNDRDAMLRLAAGYEQRANKALRRQQR
jgi:hypothetical protein